MLTTQHIVGRSRQPLPVLRGSRQHQSQKHCVKQLTHWVLLGFPYAVLQCLHSEGLNKRDLKYVRTVQGCTIVTCAVSSNLQDLCVALTCILHANAIEVVELNVGGRHFTTTRSTLCKCSGSMLAAMFSGDTQPAQQDSLGRFLIDRNSDWFALILSYLREEPLQLPTFGIQRQALTG